MEENTETNEVSKEREHLTRLLLFTPPQTLRRSIQKTFFTYLLELDTLMVPADFMEIVENHIFLIEFLDTLEQNKER